jgi:hypothetical protein
LLSQRSIEEAAKSIGIAARTLLRWQRVPEFQEAYRRARAQVLNQASARLQHATGAAVTTLLRVLVSPDAPVASKVRAAECVLDRAQKAYELEDLDVRLRRLEEAAKSGA